MRSQASPRDIRAPRSPRMVLRSETAFALLLLASDLLGLVLAWKLALQLNRFYAPLPPDLATWYWWGLPSVFWLFTGGLLFLVALSGLYHPRGHWKNYLRLAKVLSLGYLLALAIAYFYDPKVDLPRSLFFSAWGLSVVLAVVLRLGVSLGFKIWSLRQPIRAFLVAPPERQEYLSTLLAQRANYKIVGTAIASTANEPATLAAILNCQAQEVVVEGLPPAHLASTLYWQLRQHGIALRLIPSSVEMLYRRGTPEIVAALPTLRVDMTYLQGWEYRLKRYLDVILALIGLVVLAPLFIVVAIAIKLTSPGPVFFRQERVGLHGQVFQMWKFRTMRADAPQLQAQLEAQNEAADGILFKVKNDPRRTRLGSFLRKTSIDELPQLFNVLWGDMSLVGPRPLPLRDVARFHSWHHIRHQVMPGITGLWQISGRSQIADFDEAARLDLYYIDNWSLNLDLEILVETVRIVLVGSGAY
ncbi:MAG: glycosyl transferase [Thermosynechococcus sp.]|uniref:sugar transferase n=1 Tax=Thermosynechococcus sp. TaxID=2814275 RepID=UPI0021FFA6A0|nr:sugar transferase [Thermosynechococcus sp.]BCX12394.1 MAG: glycosyl transferase [Thermosynechococcus sp.]